MLDNFKAIYKILLALERAMDYPEFDVEELGLDSMKLSQERIYRYFEMLQDAGLVKNVEFVSDMLGERCLENSQKIRITLKGLEYLCTNDVMRQYSAVAANTVAYDR